MLFFACSVVYAASSVFRECEKTPSEIFLTVSLGCIGFAFLPQMFRQLCQLVAFKVAVASLQAGKYMIIVFVDCQQEKNFHDCQHRDPLGNHLIIKTFGECRSDDGDIGHFGKSGEGVSCDSDDVGTAALKLFSKNQPFM